MIYRQTLKNSLFAFILFSFLSISAQTSVNYVVVGGGGGAGAATSQKAGGGGGTGGQVLSGTLSLNSGIAYTITIGSGGTFQNNGSSSSISGSGIATITALGGNKGSNASGNTGGAGGGSNGTAYGAGGKGMDYASANCQNGGIGLYINSLSNYFGGGGGGGNYNGVSGSLVCNNGLGTTTAGGGGRGQNANGSGVGAYGVGDTGLIVIIYPSNSILASGGIITNFVGNGTTGNAGVTYQKHTFTSDGTFTLISSISSHPATSNQNICINGTTTALSVTANGTSPTYQWYSNTSNSNTGGTIISGATSASYTPPATVAGTKYYYCYVTTTNNGSAYSDPSGAININSPSVGGLISGGNSITSGSTATLTISGNTGTASWEHSTDNVTYTATGSTGNSYATPALSATKYYRAAVTNGGCTTEYTNTNTVIVTPAPAGTTSPGISINNTPLSITNNTATAIDNALTMSFSGSLSGFTVTISENYTNGDVLSYTGALPSGVTTSGFSTQRRSITFTGSATAANWQTFLQTVTLQTTSATCNPETRKVTFSASTNFYNYFNGHYYEYVTAKKNWTQARDYAASRSFYGRQGYLVVINSAEENAYISQMIGFNTWLGGTDNYKLINAAVGYTKYANQSAAEGKYHWVTGPEKGINFSNGNNSPSIPAGRYCRWQSGEPNNYNTGYYDNHVGAYGEHYMHIYADRKTWNDFPNDRYFASIIEYGGMPGDNPQGTIEDTRDIIVSVPATGSISGAATVCSGTNSTTLTLSGNAGGSTVARWEKSEDNFLETTNTLSSTSTSYTVTNLTKTTYFRAVVLNGSCSTVTKSVAITVVDLNAGDITATTNQVCTNQSAKLTLSGLVGTVQKWQTTTNTGGGSFTDIANTTTSLTHTVSSAGTHYFRSVVNTSACSTSDIYSDWYAVVATTGATPTGGAVNSQAHCSTTNSGTLELTDATGGTFTWQYSTDNGSNWTNTVVTASTYNYANVTQNTLYRVQVSNGCNTAYSSNGSVTIYGTNKCQWTGGTSTDWGTNANWCNDVIATNGADFDISPDATYNLVLDRNRTVGTINFNGAEKYIYLGNFRLTVTDIEGADTVNHIKTNGNGELRTSIANNDSFTFCVGAGTYNPVKITNKTGSTDDFMVRLIDNVYDRGSTGNPLNTPRIKRTWFIDKIGGPANSGSGIDMAFDWYNPDVSGTITTYRLYHYNGNNWDKLSAGTYATRTRNLKYSGYTGTFSPFSMGDEVVLLPVNWQNIACLREENNGTRINWATASETESDSFVVERATTAGEFRRVGAIPASGNSYTTRRYSLMDKQAPATTVFYRIKQTDKQGNGSYSEICQVNAAGNKAETVKIFPNPADNNIYVLLADVADQGGEIVISDITGKVVMRKAVQSNQTTVSSERLTAGLYTVQVIMPGKPATTQKILIQHR